MTHQDEVRTFYDGFSGTVLARDFGALSLRLLAIQDLIARFVPEGSKVLEVGCGVGILTLFLQERRCAVHSLDISPRNVETAREVAPLGTFEVMDVTADVASLRARAPFDRILLADVIEHLPAAVRPRVLATLESLLAADGLVLLSYPSPEYQEHLRRNDPAALQVIDETVRLEDLLRETSLRPVHFTYRDVWLKDQYVHLVLRRPGAFGNEPLRTSRFRQLVYRLGNRLWRFRTRGIRARLARLTR